MVEAAGVELAQYVENKELTVITFGLNSEKSLKSLGPHTYYTRGFGPVAQAELVQKSRAQYVCGCARRAALSPCPIRLRSVIDSLYCRSISSVRRS